MADPDTTKGRARGFLDRNGNPTTKEALIAEQEAGMQKETGSSKATGHDWRNDPLEDTAIVRGYQPGTTTSTFRRPLAGHTDPVVASGDPERDAGWLVNTPWLGRRMAVFGLTKDDALAQAESGRRAHVAELQALVDRWTSYELEAVFVEAESNAKQT